MSGDKYFSNVTLLLEGVSYTDSSEQRLRVTANGSSLSSNYPSVVASSYGFARGVQGLVLTVEQPKGTHFVPNSDFTIELSAYCEYNQAGGALFSNRSPGVNATGLFLGLDPSGRPFLRVTSAGVLVIQINSDTPVNLDALHTFSICRVSGKWTMFIDGMPVRDTLHTDRFNGYVDGSGRWYVGCDPHTSNHIGGISQVRVTTGIARYTGRYEPSILPMYKYPEVANVIFGPLSSAISVAGQTYVALAKITNVLYATVQAATSHGQAIGSNWSISKVPGLIDTWQISGTAPVALVNFHLIVTGTVAPALGSLSVSHDYLVMNTLNGQLTEQQILLSLSGSAALWLDSSDGTTLTSNNANQVVSFYDKAGGVQFTPYVNNAPPILDITAFTLPAITFANDSASGLVSDYPIVVTDGQSNSTIFMVGKYTGQQLGQGGGQFQLSRTADTSLINGTPIWSLTSSDIGNVEAGVKLIDEGRPQVSLSATLSILPGQNFLVVWRSKTNTASIYINQQLVSTLTPATPWTIGSGAIGFIGGALAPQGSFISVGEVLAIADDLNNTMSEQIESYLNHKWSIYPFVPYAHPPSVLVGYVRGEYRATILVFDATSVNVVGSSGRDWAIVPHPSGAPNLYLLTGLMPEFIEPLSLTINSFNGAIAGVEVFDIQVLAIPTTPVIGAPEPLYCVIDTAYVGLIGIMTASSVEVIGSTGTGWRIDPAPAGYSGNYVIRGQTDNQVGTMLLTVIARNTDNQGNPVEVSQDYPITLLPTVVELFTPFPIDLTGRLKSNLILEEAQTIASHNGLQSHVVIPVSGPFFENTLIVTRFTSAGVKQTLVHGVDYEYVYELVDLSRAAEKKLYAGIVVTKPTYGGTIYLKYQCLGGNYSLNKQKTIEELFGYLKNPSFFSWAGLFNAPTYFTVTEHELNIHTHTTGWSPVKNELIALAAYLNAQSNTDMPEMALHSPRRDNPHQVTPTTLGLGLVRNFTTSSVTHASDRNNNTTYLTPKASAVGVSVLLPFSTDTFHGKARLNVGTALGDDTNNAAALTALGLVRLAGGRQVGEIGTFVDSLTTNRSLIPVQTVPALLVFPLYWRGVKHTTLKTFRNAVSTYLKVAPLSFDKSNSTFYIPAGIPIPDLTTTQQPTAVPVKRRTVRDTVNGATLLL